MLRDGAGVSTIVIPQTRSQRARRVPRHGVLWSIMKSVASSLAESFSPQEFVLEVLAPQGLSALVQWAPPADTSAPAIWFAEVTSICLRRGHLGDRKLWDAIQRARPRRCKELHHHRRHYIKRSTESPLPRAADIDTLAETVVKDLHTPQALEELFLSCGWSGDLPHTRNLVGLVHWVFVELLREQRAAVLLKLAVILGSWGDAGAVAALTVERLALCACDDEVPRTLRTSWLSLEREDTRVQASFRSWDPPSHCEFSFDVAEGDCTREVADGLAVQLSVRTQGGGVQLHLRASSGSTWIGGTLRLCSGVRAVVRRLFPESGDRLGLGDGTLVLVEDLALPEVSP